MSNYNTFLDLSFKAKETKTKLKIGLKTSTQKFKSLTNQKDNNEWEKIFINEMTDKV